MTAGTSLKNKMTMEMVDKKLLNMNRFQIRNAICLSVIVFTTAMITLTIQQNLITQTNNSLAIGFFTFVLWLLVISLVIITSSTHISGWNLKHKEKVISIWWIVNFIPLFFASATCISLSIELCEFILSSNNALTLGGFTVFTLLVFLTISLISLIANFGSNRLSGSNGIQHQNIPQNQTNK